MTEQQIKQDLTVIATLSRKIEEDALTMRIRLSTMLAELPEDKRNDSFFDALRSARDMSSMNHSAYGLLRTAINGYMAVPDFISLANKECPFPVDAVDIVESIFAPAEGEKEDAE